MNPEYPTGGRFLLILKLNYVKNEYALDKKDKEQNEGQHGLTTKSPRRRRGKVVLTIYGCGGVAELKVSLLSRQAFLQSSISKRKERA